MGRAVRAYGWIERGDRMTIPKFRAWFKQGSKMVNVATIDFLEKEVKSHANVMYSFDEIELMQSTGLVDENGKEVFEGDVVVEEYHDSLNYGRVFYSEKKACYRVEFKNLVNGFDLADVAVKFVAGNVYENLELLEEE